ncbi:MAG: hypothetical protein JNL97_03110, partial [Verrucomicrobiales bacterium]|nr:hypothetical protein [Verrucomicrobiales bacterium]
MKQPMASVVALFALGIAIGRFADASPLALALAAVLGVLPALIGGIRSRLWLGIALVLAGWSDHARHVTPLSPFDLRSGTTTAEQLATLRGVLVASPEERVAEY